MAAKKLLTVTTQHSTKATQGPTEILVLGGNVNKDGTVISGITIRLHSKGGPVVKTGVNLYKNDGVWTIDVIEAALLDDSFERFFGVNTSMVMVSLKSAVNTLKISN